MRKLLILFVTFLLTATGLLNAQESRTLNGKVVDDAVPVYVYKYKYTQTHNGYSRQCNDYFLVVLFHDKVFNYTAQK
mgnify:CR=1 FL=1